MKIIRARKEYTEVTYARSYCFKDNHGSGFLFPCDKDGNMEPLNEIAQKNYERCQTDENIIYVGVEAIERRHVEPAVGRCACGHTVSLERSWINSCQGCGRDYNGSGQELAPREQWGEETGEHWTDIVNLRDGDY